MIFPEDKKIFGDKIFAATICGDFPGEGMFENHVWDLMLYEKQYYKWEIKILNEELLDKNVNNKKYWIKDISRKVNTYCGYGKE